MKLQGKNIQEVWDYRLSTAVPVIDRRGGTWEVQIWAKSNPDYVEGQPPAQPLEVHNTGIEAVEGDEYDTVKVKACYQWLKGVRDDYSLPDIEERKPHVAKINAANAALAEMRRV